MVDAPASAPRAGSPAQRASTGQAGTPAVSERPSAQTSQTTQSAQSEPASSGWTRVRGNPLGRGRSTAKELRKPIKASISGEPDYDVTTAYAARSTLTSIGTNVIVEIVNRSKQLHCYVQANPIGYKDPSGASIKVISTLSFATGAIGVTPDNDSTNTCLGPGESGYFLEIELMSKDQPSLFDQLAEVSLTLKHMDFDYERPNFRFSAVGYTVDKDNLTVKLRNEGPDPVAVDPSVNFRYLLMDAEDQPLMWGFLEVVNKGPAAAGETITATTDALYYDGSADHLKVAADLSTD